ARGATIYDATRDYAWPGAANVTVSIVHIARGMSVNPNAHIDSRLRPTLERPDPVPLASNKGRSFQGSILLGGGFLLSETECAALIARDPKNAERIFPYLGGEDFTSSPTLVTARRAISFGAMDLAQAQQWPDILQILQARVKPERERNKRGPRKRHWWRHGEMA